jgi:hypothetical protein
MNSTSSSLSVTGSIIATGALTASAFNISTAGTPQITSATNLNLAAGTAVIVTTSPFRLKSYTDGQTGSLSLTNGDMYYNSTTNKFVGYAGGVHVALH